MKAEGPARASTTDLPTGVSLGDQLFFQFFLNRSNNLDRNPCRGQRTESLVLGEGISRNF